MIQILHLFLTFLLLASIQGQWPNTNQNMNNNNQWPNNQNLNNNNNQWPNNQNLNNQGVYNNPNQNLNNQWQNNPLGNQNNNPNNQFQNPNSNSWLLGNNNNNFAVGAQGNLIKSCNPNPCFNSGTCVTVNGRSVCQCSPEWNGDLCQQAVNGVNCQVAACLNGGTCDFNTNTNTYTCNCPPNWFGTRCDQQTNNLQKVLDCNSTPCRNGGTCIMNPNYNQNAYNSNQNLFNQNQNNANYLNQNPVNTNFYNNQNNQNQNQNIAFNPSAQFVCKCTSTWSGDFCDKPSNNRYNSQSGSGLGSSYNAPGSNYAYGGYIPGSNANINVGNVLQGAYNPCMYSPCMNGGTCSQRTINSFLCYCEAPYRGDRCEISDQNNVALIASLSTILPVLFIIVVALCVYFFCCRTGAKNKKQNYMPDAAQKDPEAARQIYPNQPPKNQPIPYKAYHDDERRPGSY